MFTFLALILAIAAFVLALKARNEIHALRHELRMREEGAKARFPDQPVAVPPFEPVREPQYEPRLDAPPPPPPPTPVEPVFQTPPQIAATVPPAVRRGVDWERLVGINLFSWIAGIALVLAAVFLFKYSIDHGWLRPAVRATFGLVTGIALLVVCELRVARDYRLTANALDGAAIAILYATLFALHDRWQLWSAAAAFAGMAVVTVVAVVLSTRRDSRFIALLGLLGGFATPALLSSGENQPVALFSYLLLLNGGIAWIAWKKGWPLLTALSVALTAFHQWAWVSRFLTTGQLPLAAAMFLVFAAVGTMSLLRSFDGSSERAFRRTGSFAAVLPLLFAFFTAIVPEYGANHHVLFGFLLLLTTGLAAIALWRGPVWLHTLGAGATLVTFFIWLIVSYTSASWPWSLVWLGAFVALYLGADLRERSIAFYAAPLLFFVFVGLSLREPEAHVTLTGAMFALLTIVVIVAVRTSRPLAAGVAIAFAWIALLPLELQPAAVTIAALTLLLATLLTVAAAGRQLWFALAAIPLMIAALLASLRFDSGARLVLGIALLALFLLYPLILGRRARRAWTPYLASVLASGVFFVHAYLLRDALGYAHMIGVLPLVQCLLLLGIVWQLLQFRAGGARIALVSGIALAFLTAVVPLQLENEWITVALAIEVAALAWLFTRIPHRGILVWSGGLAVVVLIRLVLNPAVFEYYPREGPGLLNWYLYTYLICAAAMFVGARFAQSVLLVSAGTLELFMLLNIEIANFYSREDVLTFNFTSSSLAQDLTYTIGWALFAVAMLVAGIALESRGARIAALVLLVITILKCFLHDLGRLGGLYRVGSLLGLAVSLVIVGVILQRFVVMRRESQGA